MSLEGQAKLAVGGLPRSVRILLIEDDAALAEMYGLALRLVGHVVTIASDGEEGIALALDGDFELALLDIRLPKLNGLQVLAALKQLHGRLPVAILTNDSSPDVEVCALQLGAVDYLIKSQTLPRAVAEGVLNWLR